MTHDDIPTERLRLRLVREDALEATQDGRRDVAARLLDLDLPADWVDVVPLARRRLAQLPG